MSLNGTPVAFSGKAPKKPLELLKILLANGGRSVATGTIVEALWPDARGDAAVDSLTTTLQRLRPILIATLTCTGVLFESLELGGILWKPMVSIIWDVLFANVGDRLCG